MHHLAILILAAGKGKRMGNPDVPKVMAKLRNKELIAYVLDEAVSLKAEKTVVIVGHQRAMVEHFLAEHYPSVLSAVQEQQLGTGHAVQQCAEALRDFTGDVLILSGDVPLLSAKTLADFVADHFASNSALSVLSCMTPDPTGYGRIIRDAAGRFEAIVEHRDATEAQRAVCEINSGIYLVRSQLLFDALSHVQNSNAQQEFYLTDVVDIIRRAGHTVSAFASPDHLELMGINTLDELAAAEAVLNDRSS